MVPGSDASGLVAPISLRPVATTALPSQTIATTGALRFRVFRHVCEVFYFRGVRKRRGRGECDERRGGTEAGKREEVGVGWQPPLASTTEESDGQWVSKTMEKQHSGFCLLRSFLSLSERVDASRMSSVPRSHQS